MGSLSSTWKSWPPRRNNDDFKFHVEEESHFLFNYDEDLMLGFGEFLDRLDKVANKYDMDSTARIQMLAICNLPTMIDTMLHEESQDMSMTESVMDEVYGAFGSDAAADILEEVVWFHNEAARPKCFEFLVKINRYSPGVILSGVEAVREDDSMIYTFYRCDCDDD